MDDMMLALELYQAAKATLFLLFFSSHFLDDCVDRRLLQVDGMCCFCRERRLGYTDQQWSFNFIIHPFLVMKRKLKSD